ncbi:MAG: LysR family transcriptional regulator [Pseudomonadales bacterium]|nr:LysR family transcriptional regulator [Pseudomonadales bacterium]
MDWNALKVFIAVADSSTLAGAARALNMSHSTVYRRLNDFEAQVGRLFERVNGRYELTEVGDEMLVHSQRISCSFEDIERDVVGKDRQLKGVVKITAPSSFSYNELPRHLLELNKLYPDINVELLVTNQELNMTSRHADIAIRVTDSPPEHLVGREIRRIKWGVYAHQYYLDEHGKPNTLNDLEQHSLIGATGLLGTHPAFSWLDKKHSSNITQRTDDLVAMAYLAKNGCGLAFMPDDLKQPELERLFTFEAGKENQLWILTHPDLRKTERIKVVMKFLAEALSES